MKLYNVRVTQEFKGYVEGYIEIEARNKKEALNKLNTMTLEEIDSKVEWGEEPGDANTYDISSTQIYKNTLINVEV